MIGRELASHRRSLATALGSFGASAASFAAAQAPSEDIRDIRGPRPIASLELTWILIGAAALAVLVAILVWRWLRRRRPVPAVSDSEVALRRLDAARALMSGGGRDFSIEVSGAVREFIERRFRVMAAHRTTHEFLHDSVLSADSALASHRELLEEFLQSCDLAKFGGWNLDLGQMNAMLESARRFVQSAAGESSTAPAGSNSAAASASAHVSLPST